MKSTWKCPRCKRSFRQVNQRHSCGVGDRELLLRNKPAALIDLYQSTFKNQGDCIQFVNTGK
jgi:hypothetical protein